MPNDSTGAHVKAAVAALRAKKALLSIFIPNLQLARVTRNGCQNQAHKPADILTRVLQSSAGGLSSP
jgi:hypothetical protein